VNVAGVLTLSKLSLSPHYGVFEFLERALTFHIQEQSLLGN